MCEPDAMSSTKTEGGGHNGIVMHRVVVVEEPGAGDDFVGCQHDQPSEGRTLRDRAGLSITKYAQSKRGPKAREAAAAYRDTTAEKCSTVGNGE